MNERLGAYERLCGQIQTRLPESCRWQWEPNLQLVSTVLGRDEGETALDELSAHFERQWHFASFEHAPRLITEFVNSRFGIVPGQRVFAADNGVGLVLYAVWWPWGDDSKASLRIGMFSPNGRALKPADIQAHLTRWFHPAP